MGEQREFQRGLGGPVRATGVGGADGAAGGCERVEVVEVAADPAERAVAEPLQAVAGRAVLRVTGTGTGGDGNGGTGTGGDGAGAEAGCRAHRRPVSSR